MDFIKRVPPLPLVVAACCACVVAGASASDGGDVRGVALALAVAFGLGAFLKAKDR